MSKISILGAQGTGKTVLLTVLGQKYISPSPKGYFLEPMNREASDFIFKNWKLMTDARKWPPPTPPGQLSKLQFNLHLGSNVCELNMLDYAGEIFRDVFARNEVAPPYHQELVNYVLTSDYVLLLINLKDVVNKGAGDLIMENFWLPKAALDFVVKKSPGKKVAIVFTQIDRYREYLTECGSWRKVLEKYLPTVSAAYPGLQVLGVSAVNQVSLDDEGYTKPSEDFKQEGLEELLDWVAGVEIDSLNIRIRQKMNRAIKTSIAAIAVVCFALVLLVVVCLKLNKIADTACTGVENKIARFLADNTCASYLNAKSEYCRLPSYAFLSRKYAYCKNKIDGEYQWIGEPLNIKLDSVAVKTYDSNLWGDLPSLYMKCDSKRVTEVNSRSYTADFHLGWDLNTGGQSYIFELYDKTSFTPRYSYFNKLEWTAPTLEIEGILSGVDGSSPAIVKSKSVSFTTDRPYKVDWSIGYSVSYNIKVKSY